MKTVNPVVIQRLNSITEVEWSRYIKEITVFSNNIFKRYTWKCQIPEGKSPKDIAFEAINDILTGECTWDLEKHPEIIQKLRNVVFSKYSNLLRSKDHESRFVEKINDEGKISILEIQHSKNISHQDLSRRDDLRKRLWNSITDNTELEEIFLFLEEEWQPQEIAIELNLPIKKIYSRIRKLRYHLNKIKEEDDDRI